MKEEHMDYIVLDLEMTGLNPKRDGILEVGALRVRDNEETETLEFLVNSGRPLTPEVTELTGITPGMAEGGVRPEEAIRRVAQFTGSDVWVGHNVIYDYSFLKQLAVNAGIPFEKTAMDTLKLARKLMGEPEKKTLEELCVYLNIPRAREHRALDDARATHRLFQWMYRTYGAEHAEAFVPKPLCYHPKRQTPATKRQKMYLKELADYHKIDFELSLENLTRSDASRITDRIIARYGRMPYRRSDHREQC